MEKNAPFRAFQSSRRVSKTRGRKEGRKEGNESSKEKRCEKREDFSFSFSFFLPREDSDSKGREKGLVKARTNPLRVSRGAGKRERGKKGAIQSHRDTESH